MIPIIWSISGLDTSGGAGLAVDIKTSAVLGVHCCPLLTSVAIQDNDQVTSIQSVDAENLEQQISILKKQMPPKVIKIGLIKSKELMSLLCHELKQFVAIIILDPILETSSGYKIHTEDELQFFKDEFLQLANIVTPNLPEVEMLLGTKLNSVHDIELAAEKLLELGVEHVVIKGGHATRRRVYDYWTNGKIAHWFVTTRIPNKSVRGTGCAFASSIAAHLGSGESILKALQNTKRFLTQNIQNSASISYKKHVFNFAHRPFPAIDKIGFYPIVSDLETLKMIAKESVVTVQLRIKTRLNLDSIINEACDFARKVKLRLIINDNWQLAIKYGAYGVHLGQEDLVAADLEMIKTNGLRLGISVHNVCELERAQKLQPSYISIGPVFQSQTKDQLPPLTKSQFNKLLRQAICPVVIIGGIAIDNVYQLSGLPVSGIAVISALKSKQIGEEIHRWLAFCKCLE